MPIKILSDTVAAQIAAGEVVERPASVVKELIENSLDAGATSITVEVDNSGSKLVRISDNGYGIPAGEIELALHRHATSKIDDVEDIYHIETLGFRGEALHSIASVSRLVLTSRSRDEDMGARIKVDGGQVMDVRGVGAPSGTVIEVRDLFYNVPARRKFLKSEATERRHITTVVTNYAMAYPDVRFQLLTGGRETFNSPGSGELADVIVASMGLDVFREMVEILPLPPHRPDLPPIEVYGYSSIPGFTRSNRAGIILFVNGRAINDQRVTYAVVQAYHTLIPSGRYPSSVILVEMPADEVDVNVHPTKAEVRFRSPDAVFSAVQRAVRRAVIDQSEAPRLRYDDSQEYETARNNRVYSTPQSDSSQLAFDLEVDSPGRFSKEVRRDASESGDDEDYYPHYETATPPHLRTEKQVVDHPEAIPEGLGRPQRPRTLPILRAIGQINATYIVAEGPAGMYLVDQHAAHERILFEEFLAAYHGQNIAVQQTLETSVVTLSPVQARHLEEFQDLLAEIGFTIEPFGTNDFAVRTVPAILSDRNPESVLQLLLQDIESRNAPGSLTVEEKILRRVCKSAAVKAGQVLSHKEMDSLLRQLERCENPHTCPHGRPTMIHMSNNQLEKEFGRT
ncbi:MAG: DNA mismatch repair endonuclease MutL [Chloroflexi bacterium]|nr:DNA mismatch repair endonuclease MutL [Chloroflexota bacterium]